jgi:hypothetical protein
MTITTVSVTPLPIADDGFGLVSKGVGQVVGGVVGFAASVLSFGGSGGATSALSVAGSISSLGTAGAGIMNISAGSSLNMDLAQSASTVSILTNPLGLATTALTGGDLDAGGMASQVWGFGTMIYAGGFNPPQTLLGTAAFAASGANRMMSIGCSTECSSPLLLFLLRIRQLKPSPTHLMVMALSLSPLPASSLCPVRHQPAADRRREAP